MNERSEVIHLEDVRVRLGRRDVLAVNRFAARAGEAVALLGPNGSGKSTFLRTCALLIDPAAGEVRLFGERPHHRGQRTRLRRRTASVFTDPTLLDMSARANVEVALGIHGVPRGDRSARAESWLERLGVGRLAGARPHTLSAGEAQRVALARAFAVEPELLFLDEPFASLDFETRARLVGDLRELLNSSNVTALIATHDRNEAELLAGRLVVLVDGRMIEDGATPGVLERPASLAVASLLGHTVLTREQAGRVVPDVAPLGATAHIPPGAIEVVAEASPGARALPLLALRGAGGRVQLVVDLGAPVTFEVHTSDVARRGLQAGADVYLHIDLGRVYWLDEPRR